MATKYMNKYEIPEGFQETLNNFAREVIRNQPKDILDFGIQYFKGIEEKIGENKKQTNVSIYNSEEKTSVNEEKDNNEDKKSKEKKFDYGEWFLRNATADLTKELHEMKDESEHFSIDDNAKREPYNEWFDKHSNKKQNENNETSKKEKEQEKIEKEKEEKEKEKEKEKKEKEKKEKEEKEKEKEEKEKEDEKYSNVVERVEIPYDEWFVEHSMDNLKINDVKDETFILERKDDEHGIPYDEWFAKNCS